MKIRKARNEDLSGLVALFAQAQGFLKKQGVNQWQNGYPNTSVLQQDIAKGVFYIIEMQGQVAAGFMTALENDPYYATIDGAWLTQGQPYAVLHRIAVGASHRGVGLAGRAVAFASTQFPSAAALRADTHKENGPMRRMLEKQGFILCGNITVADGAPRVAYEKLLHNSTDFNSILR